MRDRAMVQVARTHTEGNPKVVVMALDAPPAAATSNSLPGVNANGLAATQSGAALGQQKFGQFCASCHGVIVIMSSAAGRSGYPNRSPYSTVKWGLIGFMKTLAMELGEHNIRANAILPGAVDGVRIQKVFEGRARAAGISIDEVKAVAMENQSLKFLVDPNDIASLAVFLASDAAKSISGQILPIDGDMQRN